MAHWMQCNFIQTSIPWADGSCSIGTRPSGGFPQDRDYGRARTRTREELAKERERFGIPDTALEAINLVAAQQARRLELDAQKQLDELRGELKLRGLELEAGYLEALAQTREALISAEIAERMLERLKIQRKNEEIMLLLLTVAASQI